MEPLEPKREYFQDCLTGFAFSESSLRGYCETHIGIVKGTVQDSLYCILKCISQNDAYSVRVKGWRYTVIEHVCPENPACNALLRKCLNCLPEASKLNRDLFLRAIYLYNSWEFAKLFLRPWMQSLSGFEELDAFCLLVLLENSSSLYQGPFFLDESARQPRAFYQERLRQLRHLTEACFQAEIQQITKDERDTCLQCIINVLAFIPEDGVDQVIDRILQIQDTTNIDIDTKKRIHLKTTMQEFQQKVEDFILRIPHEETQSRETVEQSQRNITEEDCGVEVKTEQNINDREQISPASFEGDYTLIKDILKNSDSGFSVEHVGHVHLELLFDREPRQPLLEDTFQAISEDNLRCIQSLIYLLERNMNSVPNDIVSSLLKALKVESTNSKVCHLTLLIIEGLLRTFCENQISKIHSNVKREFPREKLCFSAVESDICLAEGLASDTIKFNHNCKESTDCSTFLAVVACKRSAQCKLTPYTMFKHVKPQACLDNVWEFAKLFMEPYMHKCLGFADLDAFCLLTILSNVEMSDVDESCLDELLKKLYKVKDTAFKILHDTDTDMSKEATDVFLQDIIFIMENSGMPDARRALKQIQSFRTRTKTLPFEIRLNLSMKKKWIISDRNFSNWCKCVFALKYIQPPLVSLVEEKMTSLFNDAHSQFERQLCLEASSNDIAFHSHVFFKHPCPERNNPCSVLLNTIQALFQSMSAAGIYNALKLTDPQTWLRSSFDFASIFLKTWVRSEVTVFGDYDVGAIFHVIKHCRDVSQMFDETYVNKVRIVRNKTMHSADMTISEDEVEDSIDDILQFLRSVYTLHPMADVEKAIDDVQQLLTCDFRVSLEKGNQLYNEEVATVKRKMHYKRDKTCQNIEKMGKAFGITTSGTKTHASKCNGNKQEKKEVLERKWLLDKVFVQGDRQKTTKREAEEKYPEDSLVHLQRENRELEKQNMLLRERLIQEEEGTYPEYASSLLQRENRELEKQNMLLRERLIQEEEEKYPEFPLWLLGDENRELEKQNMLLRQRLEMQHGSIGESELYRQIRLILQREENRTLKEDNRFLRQRLEEVGKYPQFPLGLLEAEEKYPEDPLGNLGDENRELEKQNMLLRQRLDMQYESIGESKMYRHIRLIRQKEENRALKECNKLLRQRLDEEEKYQQYPLGLLIQQGKKRALEEENILFIQRLKSAKIAGPGEEHYPTQPLSASTSKGDKGDKGETVKEELSILKFPPASPTEK